MGQNSPNQHPEKSWSVGLALWKNAIHHACGTQHNQYLHHVIISCENCYCWRGDVVAPWIDVIKTWAKSALHKHQMNPVKVLSKVKISLGNHMLSVCVAVAYFNEVCKGSWVHGGLRTRHNRAYLAYWHYEVRSEKPAVTSSGALGSWLVLLPVSYDHQKTTRPHNPLYVLQKGYKIFVHLADRTCGNMAEANETNTTETRVADVRWLAIQTKPVLVEKSMIFDDGTSCLLSIQLFSPLHPVWEMERFLLFITLDNVWQSCLLNTLQST